MKTSFKKLTTLLMALVLIFATFGCSSDSGKGDDKEKEVAGESEDELKTEEQLDDIVGDYITFGTYEQDNDTSNGKEPIEWLVLDAQDGKALVISKYVLDIKQYNAKNVDITWETCTLRSWLNNEFINDAFTAEEKADISTVTVNADKNPEYKTDPGNATQDKVFLLGLAEVNKYFSSYSAIVCEATTYVAANHARKISDGSCCWWLRTPGYDSQYASSVYYSGEILDYYNVNNHFGIRPVLWINM